MSKKLDLFCTNKTNAMPTIDIYSPLEIFGLRFFFYSNEHHPIHVHVEDGGNDAKVEIATRNVVYNRGLEPQKLKKAIRLIELYDMEIIKAWYDYFDKEQIK